ncbi:MAG: hypothetical protein HY562_04245 [Ignavibacteriales bacterium]|nr:hypothetical protein [Ignavibacteriales bacterium]
MLTRGPWSRLQRSYWPNTSGTQLVGVGRTDNRTVFFLAVRARGNIEYGFVGIFLEKVVPGKGGSSFGAPHLSVRAG